MASEAPALGNVRLFEISRVVVLQNSRIQNDLVRAGGLEPPRGYPQRIFVPASAFAAPASREASQGSWSGLSLHPAPAPGRVRASGDPGFRCCPSSLYTFPFPGLARDCRREVSPSLGSSASPVSRGALKSLQVRCVCHSATPAWRKSYTHAARSRQATAPRSGENRTRPLTGTFPIVYRLSKKIRIDCDYRPARILAGTTKAGNIRCASHHQTACKSLLIGRERVRCTLVKAARHGKYRNLQAAEQRHGCRNAAKSGGRAAITKVVLRCGRADEAIRRKVIAL